MPNQMFKTSKKIFRSMSSRYLQTIKEMSLESDEGEVEALVKFCVPQVDIETHENLWKQVENNSRDKDVKFKYAWCLVHSKQDDVKKAIPLFEELFKEGDETMKRESLFYLSLAHAKLKEYLVTKKYITSFLSIEPQNVQAQQLLAYAQKRLKSDGLTGMAIVGGLALIGGLTAIAVGGIAAATSIGLTRASKNSR